jgi:hypothetical protein
MRTVIVDTNSMLNPIPIDLIVNSDVNDPDVVFINKRCVVHAKYSENELIEIEKGYGNVSEWEAFYDNYSFYNDDVSMYIYERSLVITESDKKHIQFVLATGDKITIDRKKSLALQQSNFRLASFRKSKQQHPESRYREPGTRKALQN